MSDTILQPDHAFLSEMILIIDFQEADTGQASHLPLPFEMLCHILPVLQTASPKAINSIIVLAATAVMHPLPASEEQLLFTRKIFNTIRNTIATQWHDQDELLIKATYELLAKGRITRTQAAAVAKAALGGDITTESWRKRVDRYASAHHWPLPGKPRGGKR